MEYKFNKKINKKINALDVVPLALRKKIYAQALEMIKTKQYSKVGLDKGSLCLLLPCLLWGVSLDHPHSLRRQTGLFFTGTDEMFPELTSYLKKHSRSGYTDKKRVNFLKTVI